METKDRTVMLAMYFSVAVAIVIVSSKVFGWYYTDSSTILASLTDSLLDVATSCVNMIAARYALQPPDNEHRFGHGKAEDLAVFTQASFFALSGLFLLGVSIRRIISPVFIEHSEFGIFIMTTSIVFTLLLISYQTYAYHKTKSKIILADRLHYFVDLLSNLAVILSLAMTKFFNNLYIDPIFAMLIAFYILYGAAKLVRNAFKNLMDHEMDEDHRNIIKKIIRSDKKVKGFHDLKTRYSGRKAVIQFHLELDGKMSLHEAHHITENIEKNICNKFKNADVIVHQDPSGVEEEVEFVS